MAAYTYTIIQPPGAKSSSVNGVTASGLAYGSAYNGSANFGFVYDSQAQSYAIFKPTGATSSNVGGISASGVVYGSESTTGGSFGFLADAKAQGFTILKPTGAMSSSVAGITGGGVAYGSESTGSASYAYAYDTQSQTYTILKSASAVSSYVNGTTDTGLIYGSEYNGSTSYGFVYDSQAQSYTIFKSTGATSSNVGGISASGVVYGSESTGGTSYGYLSDAKAQSFTILKPTGAVSSSVAGITGGGVAYGSAYTGSASYAYAYDTQSQAYTILKSAGATYSSINGVSASGLIYGSEYGGSTSYSFVYDTTAKSYTLLQPAGATSSYVNGVSASGVVYGSESGAGGSFGLLATPAAPPTIALSKIAGDDTVNAAEGTVGYAISGTTDAAVGQTVTVTIGSAFTGTATVKASATTGAPNTFSVSVPADTGGKPTLADGSYMVSAKASNAGGSTTITKTLTVDETAPAIAITMPVAGDNVVNKTEADNGFTVAGTSQGAESGQPVTVKIVDGSGVEKASLGTTTGSEGKWSVQVSSAQATALADGRHTVVADVSDKAGNPAITATQGLTVDQTAPTITGIVPSTTGPTNATTLTQTVTLSEAATGLDASDFTVVGTNGATATVSSVAPTGTPGVYTVTLTNVGGTGQLQLRLDNDGTVKDAAGNALTGTLTGTATAVDHTPPTIAGIVPSTVGPTNATSIVERVTFSEAVTGVDAGDFVVTGMGTARAAVGAVTAVSATAYDVLLTGITGDGTVRLDLRATGTGIVDLAGNAAPGYTSGLATVFDNTGPAVPRIVLAHDTGASATDRVTSDAGLAVTPTEGGSIQYRVDGGAVSTSYDPGQLADGRHTVSILERDALGNPSAEASLTFTLDRTAPKIALAGAAGQANHAAGRILSGDLGAADAGLVVTVRDGTTVLGTTTADNAGHFAFVITDTKAGPSHSYSLTATATATDLAGNVGTSTGAAFAFDYTPNRELFGTVAQDATSHLGQVYALYEGLLDRAPDEGGARGWVNALDRGASLRDVTQAILNSAEGQSHLGAAGNADFVDQLYTTVLDRAADAGGKQAWAGALDRGATRADVADAFVFSSEHLGGLKGAYDAGVYLGDPADAAVARLYHGLLDRAPDAGGLAAWEAAAHNGMSLSTIAQALIGSGEYAAVHGAQTNGQFVESLYAIGLGHADGGAGWVAQLAQGASRADVAVGILQSSEAQAHLVGQIEQGWHLV